MQWRLTRFPILASTNDLALEWIRAGHARAGDVLVTEEQAAGRGRHGRTWVSPRGALLMTAVLPAPRVEGDRLKVEGYEDGHAAADLQPSTLNLQPSTFNPQPSTLNPQPSTFNLQPSTFNPQPNPRLGWTALASGIAVARAVGDLGAPAGVKWPNDVVLERRKLAGILVEAAGRELVAIGIGMNVRNALPEGTPVPATRLADRLPDASVEEVLQAVLSRLDEAWALLTNPDPLPLRRAWEALDTTAGRRVRWVETAVCGTAEGVDEIGALRIRAESGVLLTAVAGEVRFED